VADERTDLPVRVSNMRNKHFGRTGKIKKMDRGNVYVDLVKTADFPAESICTRWNCLVPVEE